MPDPRDPFADILEPAATAPPVDPFADIGPGRPLGGPEMTPEDFDFGVWDYLNRFTRDLATSTLGVAGGVGGLVEQAYPPLTPETEAARQGPTKFDQFIRGAKESMTAAFPIDPEVEQTYANQLVGGLASTVPILAAGAVNPALGFGTGVSMGVEEARVRAQDAGATGAETRLATLLGVGPGATEFIPIARLLRVVRNPIKRTGLVEFAINMVKQGAWEGTQEAVQQGIQNEIARQVYNPEQARLEGVVESAKVGAGVGALLGGGASVVPSPPPVPPEVSPGEPLAPRAPRPPPVPAAAPVFAPEAVPVEEPPAVPPSLPPAAPTPQPADDTEAIIIRRLEAHLETLQGTAPPRPAKSAGSGRADKFILSFGPPRYPTSINVEVLANPTFAAAARLAKGAEGEVRALREETTGDVFMWSAGTATHRDIAESLGVDISKQTLFEAAVYKGSTLKKFAEQGYTDPHGLLRREEPATEPTAQGEQILTPGVEPITEGDRVAAPEVAEVQKPPKTTSIVELMLWADTPAKAAQLDTETLRLIMRSSPDGAVLDQLAENPGQIDNLAAELKRRTEAPPEPPTEATAAQVEDPFDEEIWGPIARPMYRRSPSGPEPGARHLPGGTASRGKPVAKPSATPLSRNTIIRDFLGALDLRLYPRVRGIKKRFVSGFYRKHIREVRIRQMSDMETVAHEVAHAIDRDLDPSIRKELWVPARNANKVYREELRAVSYDKKKLLEGWAEFVRLWTTQSDEAAARAPALTEWMDAYVERSPLGPPLKKVRDDMHAWFAQDPATQLKSKIGVRQPSLPERALAGFPAEVVEDQINPTLHSRFERFRQWATDDLQGLYTMEHDLTAKIAPAGVYESARLVRGVHSLIEGALIKGVPVYNRKTGDTTYAGKPLLDILRPVAKELDNFFAYAVARSAVELKLQGRENLFTNEQIAAGLALETPAFKKAGDEYQTYNKGILDYVQAKGVIDPEGRKLWRRDFYIPFYRVTEKAAGKAGGATPGESSPIKALTGGTGNLRDILTNMIGNTSMLLEAAEINDVMLKVAKLSQAEGGAKFITKISRESKPVRLSTEEVARVVWGAMGLNADMIQKGAVPKGLEPLKAAFDGQDALMQFWLHNQKPADPDKTVVAVLRRGKPYYMEVADPMLMQSLTRLRRPARHPLVRWLGLPRRIGQATVTLTIDFMAANIARDTAMGTIFSKHGFRFGLDSIIGFKSRIVKDRDYWDFIANGGGFASYMIDPDAMRTAVQRSREFAGRLGVDPRTIIDTPAKALLALERIADAFEMSTRLGEFKRARHRGASKRHAAYEAREISTDFAMRGDSELLGFFYDTAMFFKAGMNGLDRGYRGFFWDTNKGQIRTYSALLAAASTALWFVNEDNPEYDELADWDKWGYWHFFIPRKYLDGGEGSLHLRYPKIWEIGALATMAEESARSMRDGLDARSAGNFTRIFLGMFNMNAIPQALRPALEVVLNRNLFLDRPVVTREMEDLEPYAQASAYTSETARAAGEATRNWPKGTRLSPVQLEHLVRGYFNTWGLYGLMTSDAIFFDDTADIRTDQIPGLRRFYEQTPTRHSRYVTEFYELANEASASRATMRKMEKRYRGDLADEEYASEENAIADFAAAVRDQLSAIRNEMNFVRNAPDLPTLQKYARDERSRTVGSATYVGKRDPGFYRRLRVGGKRAAWNDLGALKAALLDSLLEERNAEAKRAVIEMKKDMEASRDG